MVRSLQKQLREGQDDSRTELQISGILRMDAFVRLKDGKAIRILPFINTANRSYFSLNSANWRIMLDYSCRSLSSSIKSVKFV